MQAQYEILTSWKEIAAFLRISEGKARELARNHNDFPIFRDGRIFTTIGALTKWIEQKAMEKKIS
jgi:hypothetical protein